MFTIAAPSRRILQVLAALSFLAGVRASAWHLDLDIDCVEPTPWPKCCTAVSDSGGAGAHYVWEVIDGYGYVEPMETFGELPLRVLTRTRDL